MDSKASFKKSPKDSNPEFIESPKLDKPSEILDAISPIAFVTPPIVSPIDLAKLSKAFVIASAVLLSCSPLGLSLLLLLLLSPLPPPVLPELPELPSLGGSDAFFVQITEKEPEPVSLFSNDVSEQLGSSLSSDTSIFSPPPKFFANLPSELYPLQVPFS